MPTVPGYNPQNAPGLLSNQAKQPSVEQLLMTAADMGSRGQLYQDPVSYNDPRASMKLPVPRGARNTGKGGKRR